MRCAAAASRITFRGTVACWKSSNVDPLGNTPDEFAALIKADTATWADAVAVMGLNTPQ
jgi:hypothetical protein